MWSALVRLLQVDGEQVRQHDEQVKRDGLEKHDEVADRQESQLCAWHSLL